MTGPAKPLGMSDFFALEAGEYLERLDGLLAKSDTPSADEFVRVARALRGSALMANQAAIARAAAGLEGLARAVREGRRAWDAATQQLAVRSVDDLKIFVRRASAWTEADTAKAGALAQELEQLAGRPSGGAGGAQIRAAEAVGLDAGARAFVAREGAAIASALDRAAQALRANPLAHDSLQPVLRALQPLRGLAAVNDLPPLPDLLDGIERAIAELSRSGIEPPANVGDLFQAAATAIARSARDVAERGRPDPEGAEFRRFADLIVRFIESEPDVVPIGSLYYGDSGPHIVSRGVPVARPSTLGRLELVSHGDHLRQAADSLERASSATQRELRAHTLGTTFRALAIAGGGVLADRVAQFAIAAREAVASGVAVNNPAAFAAELRRAGHLLARSNAGDEEALASELDGFTAAIRALQPAAPAPVRPSGPVAAPAPAAAGVTPHVEASVPESADLVGSWAAYERLARAGMGPASLDALLAGAPAVSAVPAVPADPAVVDVRLLLYRGERALKRAQELRETARGASGDALRALIEEVCDLVALAVEPPPTSNA
jgi:HPt (histidine-containing phosphotransfer) domain-containing protein